MMISLVCSALEDQRCAMLTYGAAAQRVPSAMNRVAGLPTAMATTMAMGSPPMFTLMAQLVEVLAAVEVEESIAAPLAVVCVVLAAVALVVVALVAVMASHSAGL